MGEGLSQPTFSEDMVNLRYVSDDALRDTMRDGASLASRAAAADDGEHVECTKHTRKLERAHNALTVRRRREELIQRHVVDQHRRRRHRHVRRGRRRRKGVVHHRREGVCVWGAGGRGGGRGKFAHGYHPDARSALFASADGVRAAVAVEWYVLTRCAREYVRFVVPLEEREHGLDALCERGVARGRCDARALFEVGEDGNHASVARRRERAHEHRRQALAVAPEVLRWGERSAGEGRQGEEFERGKGAAAALEGRL